MTVVSSVWLICIVGVCAAHLLSDKISSKEIVPKEEEDPEFIFFTGNPIDWADENVTVVMARRLPSQKKVEPDEDLPEIPISKLSLTWAGK